MSIMANMIPKTAEAPRVVLSTYRILPVMNIDERRIIGQEDVRIDNLILTLVLESEGKKDNSLHINGRM